MNSVSKFAGLVLGVCAMNVFAASPEAGWPRVCRNTELVKAMHIITSACNEISCDPSTLKRLDTDVDKPTLLAALRDPGLIPVHIFFPNNESEIVRSLHWYDIKKSQLDSLRYIPDPTNAVVFVIGQASVIGSNENNFELSRKRMNAVMIYIEKVLNIRCRSFRGGWLGEDVFQLNKSDARLLNIEASDFDEDEIKLNQAVHVFVFPCADLLK